MQHVLPSLPYRYAALTPTIDARTMTLHHDVHHVGYVTALNDILERVPELVGRTALWLLLHPDKIPKPVRTAVRNNAGGHINHSLFWRAMSPQGGGVPSGSLAKAIDRDFGSFEEFKDKFAAAGGKVFGSGWVWLVREYGRDAKLAIVTTAGHENPLEDGKYPILLNDVWEHAYYLGYESRRSQYLKEWWKLTDWNEASRRFEHMGDTAEDSWDVERESISG